MLYLLHLSYSRVLVTELGLHPQCQHVVLQDSVSYFRDLFTSLNRVESRRHSPVFPQSCCLVEQKNSINSKKLYLIFRLFLYGWAEFPSSVESKVFQIMNLSSSSEIVNYTSSDYSDSGGSTFR